MNIRTKALRNTMFSSVGIYTEYVLGMLTSIFIARHLGPSEFGAYSAIIWLVAMVKTCLPVGQGMTPCGVARAMMFCVAAMALIGWRGDRETTI